MATTRAMVALLVSTLVSHSAEFSPSAACTLQHARAPALQDGRLRLHRVGGAPARRREGTRWRMEAPQAVESVRARTLGQLVEKHVLLAAAVQAEDFPAAAQLRDEMARLRERDPILANYAQIKSAVEAEDFDEAIRLRAVLSRTLIAQSTDPPPLRRLLVCSLPGRQEGGSLVSVDEGGANAVELVPAGYSLATMDAAGVPACAWSPSGHFVAMLARRVEDGREELLVVSSVDGEVITSVRLPLTSACLEKLGLASGAPEERGDGGGVGGQDVQWSACGRYVTWTQSLDGKQALMSHVFAPSSSPWGGPCTRALLQGSRVAYSHVADASGRLVAAVLSDAATTVCEVEVDPQAEVAGVQWFRPLLSAGVDGQNRAGCHCPVAISSGVRGACKALCIELVREDPGVFMAAVGQAEEDTGEAVQWIPRGKSSVTAIDGVRKNSSPVFIHAYMHTWIHIHTCVHERTHVCVCVCVCVCANVHAVHK